ncbi:MAG TPA: hypothetical protein VL995_11425 [Cellvibrio sp.]|nr:hypothetical protein [Cellvibrio sp.]
MPHEIGFLQNTGTLAHYMMLDKIKTFAEANGYTILRYDVVSANRELIMKAPGYSGTEEIFIGFRTYHNVSSDYYNLTVAVFTGYVPGNTFATQPGALLSGVPAHNNRIDYWLTLNPQRIALVMKVGTPVYEAAYAGKFNKYAFNSQFPYPVAVGGMLNGEATTRFSDTTHGIPYKGNRANMRMRFNDGVWKQVLCHPWDNADIAGSTYSTRDTNNSYPLEPVILKDAQGLYGELDGIFQISGFNNATENTLVDAGITYVVFQDVSRNGFNDYFAMRLDA